MKWSSLFILTIANAQSLCWIASVRMFGSLDLFSANAEKMELTLFLKCMFLI